MQIVRQPLLFVGGFAPALVASHRAVTYTLAFGSRSLVGTLATGQ
jgi:hypothetical protein